MKTWITLTEDDLREHLNAAQRETLLARPNRAESNDALTAIFTDTVTRIRNDIRSVETNFLAEDELTIPPELKRTASLLALVQLPGRIAGITLSFDQEAEASEAESVLTRIRSGSLPVSLPTTPETSPAVRTSFGLEVARKRESRISGSSLRGL